MRELLKALARRNDRNRYVVYARERWDEPLDDRFSWRLFRLPDPWWHLRTAAAANAECDVFLSTNSYLTVWFLRTRSAVVVYDLVAFQPGAAAKRRSARIEHATIGLALRRTSVAICISEATRRDLISRFPDSTAKARTVHLAAPSAFENLGHAADVEDLRRRYAIDRPFVLCVGTLEPRKNLVRVIDAYTGLPPDLRSRYRLAIVGPRGWEYEAILERARSRAGEIAILGHVPDEDLAGLYRLCDVFCYPSLYEGFGLPLLEAMAAARPCITSNVSSLPEIGGESVFYVDPTSVASIREGLARLLERDDERAALGERAARRARTFSWDRTADDVLGLLASSATP
ncbi:MAG: glycosyltransferase family 4 protein [Actinomycetota bacterium]|nr:glycosyltransferase family 4 protein [Actinomycetota bacterium]